MQRSILRTALLIAVTALSALRAEGSARRAVVADSATRSPLPNATVFDRHGNVAGMTDSRGRMPSVADGSRPLTVRCLGYCERTVAHGCADTIFMRESVSQLPEVVVESRHHKVMHMLAYVREYSTLNTYTDTVFLFREKMVDYMIVPGKKIRFRGWSEPRVLSCRSYYRFTNAQGLDSVSDQGSHHFSWSDWIGVTGADLPAALLAADSGTDTVKGRYGPSEIWTRHGDRVAVDVNVLADTAGRKWVPNLSAFFRNHLDFEKFRLKFNYDNVTGRRGEPTDLTGYSYTIESNGRGMKMYGFNKLNEPIYVSTYAEVYLTDKEYITVKEARKWEPGRLDAGAIGIYVPDDVPELQPSTVALMDRVNNIDKELVRLDATPDRRLVSANTGRDNFKIGNRLLLMLKDLTGISLIKSKKKADSKWNAFRKQHYGRKKRKK